MDVGGSILQGIPTTGVGSSGLHIKKPPVRASSKMAKKAYVLSNISYLNNANASVLLWEIFYFLFILLGMLCFVQKIYKNIYNSKQIDIFVTSRLIITRT